ncbi:MAG: hypothetical protein SGJ27_05410 [Candidatus Melainabacteria bacterium]|nr:hypothetical protein [Candidatus Melainabacteria bacterium]
MSAVAVKDYKPSADELLQWHLSQGWQPQVSELVDGARVLGHASCMFEPAEIGPA